MANYNYSKPDLVKELLKRKSENTPDFLSIKMKGLVPVFVYGTLKIGQKRHDVLRGCPYLGEGYTATRNYVMENSEMDFPVVRNASGTGGGSVLGEVFMVDPITMLELDKIEANGEMYQREERWIYLTDQSIQGKFRPSMKCWIYLGIPSFWRDYSTTLIKSKDMTVRGETRKAFEWIPSFSSLEEMHQSQKDFGYSSEWNDRIPF